MATQKCICLALSVFILSACNKTSNAPAATSENATSANTGAVIELPATVLGVFTGTLMGTSNGTMVGGSQFANATISKKGNDVSISFSGGIPGVDAKFPSIQNLQFVDGGRGIETYQSNAGNGSVAGVYLSAFKTNLNIDNVDVGGIKIIYTGVKCDVAPEVPVCICVTNPGNPMCQKK